MQMMNAKPALCGVGRHRPDRGRAVSDGGVTRTRCRDCGCDLVQTLVSRKWYRSGLFS